jgi:integral membrane protein
VPAEQSPTPTRAPAPSVPPKVLSALARYRISALVVGVGLIILCITIVLKYAAGWGQSVEIWGPIHGALYVIYVLLAFDLAYKDRWSLLGVLKVLVAGVIPGVSFVAERWVHRNVLARKRI